jgi:RinA family phage transcriptional activator
LNEERLPKHIYKFVEAELENYRTYQKLIQEYDRELLYSGAKSGLSKDPSGRFSQGQTSDSTHNEASRVIANEARIVRMVDMVRCIEDVLINLPNQDQNLIELKYFQGRLTDWGVSKALHISLRSYYRQKNKIIKSFALRMRLL